MIRSVLAGIETEYGFSVDGRGAESQVEDAIALVRSYPGERFVGWDYRYESPRHDLRGFTLERLQVDPEDLKFDEGRQHGLPHEVRADRILPNGARLYNDHGHPEYATPECLSLDELALHDLAGQFAVHEAARAWSDPLGLGVRVYKNNTDFHGASYGTHESYLVPRSLGFDALYRAVLPILVTRQILTGSGKVGSESGRACTFQISQRADFLVEPANTETLYRRPIFNTRDEPHSNPSEWIRLHVISGDANMMPIATKLKVGLVKIAIGLALAGDPPIWKLADPVEAMQSISRDETYAFEIPLASGWTNAYEIIESYLAAAEATLCSDEDLVWVVDQARRLLAALRVDFGEFRRHVDWAAKRAMLEHYLEEEGSDWRDSSLRSFDLEYHNVDPEDGLFFALSEIGEVESTPPMEEIRKRRTAVFEPTRAFARGLAVRKFSDSLRSASWRSLVLECEGEPVEVELWPDGAYPAQLETAPDVGTFIEWLRGIA